MILSKLNEDIISSMKSGNGFRVSTLKGLKSALESNSKDKNPKTELQVAVQYKNMLTKALDQYMGKFDKMKEINSELKVISEYLPKEMSVDEVMKLISEVKLELGDNVNMGMMMKALKPKTEGKFNGKELSKLVKESLI
jgi:uncharacterized protein YqeY